MKRVVIPILSGLLISGLLGALSYAQEVSIAQIYGTVRDQTGAASAGAEVTVTQTDTGLTRNTLSDKSGSYTLPNLPPGPYRLEVSMPGFRTYVQTGIVLQVNANPAVAVVLQPGQPSDQVNSGVGQDRNYYLPFPTMSGKKVFAANSRTFGACKRDIVFASSSAV